MVPKSTFLVYISIIEESSWRTTDVNELYINAPAKKLILEFLATFSADLTLIILRLGLKTFRIAKITTKIWIGHTLQNAHDFFFFVFL